MKMEITILALILSLVLMGAFVWALYFCLCLNSNRRTRPDMNRIETVPSISEDEWSLPVSSARLGFQHLFPYTDHSSNDRSLIPSNIQYNLNQVPNHEVYPSSNSIGFNHTIGFIYPVNENSCSYFNHLSTSFNTGVSHAANEQPRPTSFKRDENPPPSYLEATKHQPMFHSRFVIDSSKIKICGKRVSRSGIDYSDGKTDGSDSGYTGSRAEFRNNLEYIDDRGEDGNNVGYNVSSDRNISNSSGKDIDRNGNNYYYKVEVENSAFIGGRNEGGRSDGRSTSGYITSRNCSGIRTEYNRESGDEIAPGYSKSRGDSSYNAISINGRDGGENPIGYGSSSSGVGIEAGYNNRRDDVNSDKGDSAGMSSDRFGKRDCSRVDFGNEDIIEITF